jgi:hypothetical protein
VDANGSGLSNQTVTLDVNCTAYPLQTNVTGYAMLHFALQPWDTSVNMYQVLASFNRTNPRTPNLNMSDPCGTQYAVCTTIQYGYKPSSNATVLTVKPTSTDYIVTTANTPEQMQQEARQSGALTVYNEWSWWYPWYRLHFVGNWNGETLIDVGVAALPFADTGYLPDTTFKGKMNEWLGKIVFNVLTSLVVTEFALWAASNLGPIYFGLVLLGYIVYKSAMLGTGWNSVESLYVSLVSTVVSTAISAWTGLCSFLPANLRALAADAESIKNVAFAFLCKIIMIPVNMFLLMMTWNRIVELGGT